MPAQRSPGAPTLVLVPTPDERTLLAELGGLPAGHGLSMVCGFGPVAAAARTAGALVKLSPRRVLLLGIAGTLDPELLPVGAAATFARVGLQGVGVGEGPAALGPRELGWPQWPGQEGSGAGPVVDELPLSCGPGARDLLLSVCAASADAQQAAGRAQRFPGACAEDMEAFGVALACHLHDVPLTVVRGVSNVAGDREHARWQVREALASARLLAIEVLEGAYP